MSEKKHEVDLHKTPKNILAGALVLTPLLATSWVVCPAWGHLGRWRFSLPSIASPPSLRNGCVTPGVEYVTAVVLTLVVLYLLGWATIRVMLSASIIGERDQIVTYSSHLLSLPVISSHVSAGPVRLSDCF